MTLQFNPYLAFKDGAREAMELYQSVFGGRLDITTFGEFDVPGVDPEGVMHARLDADGIVLMASDTPEQLAGPYIPGNNVACSLSGDDGPTLRQWWDRLAEGGQVRMPLERQAWGDVYGLLIDRFGIIWHVNISEGSDAEKA